MNRPLIGVAALSLAVVGMACSPPRALLKPTYVEPGDYIYFVEQEGRKDSRLKKCDVAQDKSVQCTTQFDLDD